VVETPRDSIKQGYLTLAMSFSNPSQVSLYDEDTITIRALNDVIIEITGQRYGIVKGTKASSKVPN